MHLIRLTILLSTSSCLCWAQTTPAPAYTTSSSDNSTTVVVQNGPVLQTPSVLLTPNGPVGGTTEAQIQSANQTQGTANQTANSGTGEATQSTDMLQGSSSQESLGQVARQFRAQKGEQGHATKTYTEDDLRNMFAGSHDQTENIQPAYTPDVSSQTASNIGGNSSMLPQSDEAAENPTAAQSQSNEKPSARGRSVVNEVNDEVRRLQKQHRQH